MLTLWRDGDRLRSVELAAQGPGRYRVTVDGTELDLAVESFGDGRLRLTLGDRQVMAEVTVAGLRCFVRIQHMDFVIEREAGGRRRAAGVAGGGLEAPMPGVVTRVLVAQGDQVTKGQPLLAIEAMKMEHLIRAPLAGRVRRVSAAVGEMVNGGVPLIELEAAP